MVVMVEEAEVIEMRIETLQEFPSPVATTSLSFHNEYTYYYLLTPLYRHTKNDDICVFSHERKCIVLAI